MKRRVKHIDIRGGGIKKGFIFSQLLVLMLAAAFLVGTGSARAQAISSSGSNTGGGAWNTGSTWTGGTAPTSSNDVTIVTGDSVYTTAAVSCRSLTIQPGAKLVVNTGSLTMTGDFAIGANAWFYDNYSMKAWPSNATSYTIDPASNFVLMASGPSNLGTQTADSTFGSVYILKSGVTCSANLNIQGDLTINYGSTSSAFRGITGSTVDSIGTASLTHHVHGNVYLITGLWSAVDGNNNNSRTAMSCVWNVDGNVSVGDYSTASGAARFGPFSSDDGGNISNFAEFNIGGNLTVVNGAKLQASNSTSNNNANTGEINIGGNLTLDTSVVYATNANGETFSINFVGSKTQTVSVGKAVSFSSTTHLITLCDTVGAKSTVQFTGSKSWNSNCPSAPSGNGTFVVFGKLFFGSLDTLKGLQNFILKPGATLGTANVNGIDTTTGSIQVSAKTVPSTASYVYNGTAAQVAGNAFPSTVSSLTVSDTAGVTLASSDTVTGTLTLNSGGKLKLNSNSIFVSNNKANAVVGDTVSYIVGDSLTRAQGTTTGAYLFPIGTASGYRGLTINYTTAPTAATNLTASFSPSDPTSSGLPSGISSYWNGGYWKVSSSGIPGGLFALSLYSPEAAAVNSPVTIIGKPSLSVPWIGLNLTSSHSSTISGKWLTESGVSSYGIYGIGYGTLTSVNKELPGVPTKMAIGNYPNPFNPSTVIRIAVPKNAHVTLTIYDDLGQKVLTLVDQNLTAGYYDRLFDGSRLASGVYFSRLNIGNQVIVGKMLMLK